MQEHGVRKTVFLFPAPSPRIENRFGIKVAKFKGSLQMMRVPFALCPPALPKVDIPGRQQIENFSISGWTSECATASCYDSISG
eukprot:1157096-Pelagomonas_calceolata.AAC.4